MVRVSAQPIGITMRANFDIKGTDNVAKSISLDVSNTGGSGLEGDTGINQDLGGSGLDHPVMVQWLTRMRHPSNAGELRTK